MVPGDTDTEPPATGVTAPMPLIEALLAFELVHVSVDELPCAIDVGLALNVPVGAAGAETVTVAVLVIVPPAPVSVSV